MIVHFYFTQKTESLYDKRFLYAGFEYPEDGFARFEEANCLDWIATQIVFGGKQRDTFSVLSQSESVLRRLQRYIAEADEDSFFRHDNTKVFFVTKDDEIIDMGLTHYGQLTKRQPKNFFDTISDDLDAMTVAALDIRIKELEGN